MSTGIYKDLTVENLTVENANLGETPDAFRIPGAAFAGILGYAAGFHQGAGTAGVAFAATQLLAVPFITARGGTVNQLSVDITTGAAATAGMAIYAADPVSLYPTTLIAASGFVSIAAPGVISVPVNASLPGGVLVYACFLSPDTPGTAQFLGLNVNVPCLFGVGPTIVNSLAGWSVIAGVGFPAVMPAGGGLQSPGALPVIVLSYASVGA